MRSSFPVWLLFLSMFLPLIISSGGNSGSQATTLVIRAMALGEVNLRDWWRVMSREVQAGLSLGAIGTARVAIWSIVGEHHFHRQLYGPHWPLVALTVGIALVGVVLWGSLSGSMLSFILRRLGPILRLHRRLLSPLLSMLPDLLFILALRW